MTNRSLNRRDAFVTLAPRDGVKLKHGGTLPSVRVAASFYGREFTDAPTILVSHALTGSGRIDQWWSEVLGPRKLLDTDRFCVACTNAIGSCYGSTGPSSLAPDGEPWGYRFPVVTVEDMVAIQREALATLGIVRVAVAIGGSLGGQQALQWGSAYPRNVSGVVGIGTTGRLSPMGIGLNHIAREAIKNNPAEGLKVARMIGMLSYKSATLLWRRHGRKRDRGGADPGAAIGERFDVEGYLQHQGDKLAARMDPASYAYLTKAMDLYDLDPAGWHVPALLVGIDSDWLYPPDEVEFTAERLAPHARFARFASDHGHDGFLADADQLTSIVRPFIDEIVAEKVGMPQPSGH
jgi:homoserine O-acetyltransferase/O-succinyltransferase